MFGCDELLPWPFTILAVVMVGLVLWLAVSTCWELYRG